MAHIKRVNGRVLTILFDFNGTLVDSKGAQIESWRLALAESHLPGGMRPVFDGLALGLSSYEIASLITDDPRQKIALVETKRRLFDQLIFEAKPVFPLLCEVLRCLTVIAELHVLSLYSEPKIREWLSRADCAGYFKSILGRKCQMECITKRSLLKSFLAEHGTTDVFFIGDTKCDKVLAEDAGVSFLLVRTDRHPEGLYLPAEKVVQSYVELFKIIAGLYSPI